MQNIFTEHNVRMILDYVRDGIQAIDASGNLIYCNRPAAVLDDINIENSLGKHVTEIYPSLTQESSTLLKVLRSGMPILEFEQTFTNYKGKIVTTINSTLPIRMEGKIVGAMEISHNITDVKVLSEKVADLQNKVYGSKLAVLQDEATYTFESIISKDIKMQRAKTMALKASHAEIPVMVWGDTGTGKELFVHAIHNASVRRKKAFIAQNCAALPGSLLEGILFGTVKGSFTGSADRVGLFETADGGTLFLDEVNSMPMELQGKLLRALQDGTFRRVGDVHTRKANVRVIAATNVDPLIAVQEGHLRQDLYYRLNTVTIALPKLSERQDDLDILTDFFIRKFNDKLYRNVKGVSNEVKKVFESYAWPGNVRELEHVIEGAMSLMDGDVVEFIDLPTSIQRQFEGVALEKETLQIETDLPMKEAIEQLETQYIQNAMKSCGGNISRAAAMLDMPRQTLQYRLKRMGFESGKA
jgi:arginine utilization regulatory protein